MLQMKNNEARNYKECIATMEWINDGFTTAGFEDGYADFENDAERILLQLHGVCNKENLINYINNYLNGYEVGKFMSENADKIYDEDGDLKEDEYSLEPCEIINRYSAEFLVRNYKKNK